MKLDENPCNQLSLDKHLGKLGKIKKNPVKLGKSPVKSGKTR